MKINTHLTIQHQYLKQLEKTYTPCDILPDLILDNRKLIILYLTLSHYQAHPHEIIQRICENQQITPTYHILILFHLDEKDELNYLLDLQLKLIPFKCKFIILWTTNEIIDFLQKLSEKK